jgi:hypothetical protein
MKKQLILVAFAIAVMTMTACQWESMKKEVKSTDSTIVITDSVEAAIDSVVVDSVESK